jgi:hypothetical protein
MLINIVGMIQMNKRVIEKAKVWRTKVEAATTH